MVFAFVTLPCEAIMANRSPRSGRVLRWQGVCYFPSYEAARAVADAFGLSRIISYQLGWAVQKRVSGPYIGPDDLRRMPKATTASALGAVHA
jgi:hypothetical protein